MTKVYIVSDTHYNHDREGGVMETHCKRPSNFSQLVFDRWNQTVKPEDLVVHVGDVLIGPKSRTKEYLDALNGRKILVRGNHDTDKPCLWWMNNGFAAASDGMLFRNIWVSHKPADVLPAGAELNLHGHLHNIWDGFVDPKREERDRELLGDDYLKRLKNPWQRLFALEYTDYRPVEWEKFFAHPERYQATGPKAVDLSNRVDGELVASSDTEGWRE